MPKLITLGETMVTFTPTVNEPLRYVTDYRAQIAGAESNLAIGIQKLGHPAGWISKLGEDEFGHMILNKIRAEGVDTSQVIFDERHSSGIMFKQPSFIDETKVYYYRENSAARFLSPENIDEAYIRSAEILHLTGITPVLSESCRLTVMRAIEIAQKNNILISFDPNIRFKLWAGENYSPMLEEFLMQSDIVSMGMGEASVIFKTRDVNEIFKKLFEGRAEYIAIKNGASGSWVGTKEAIYQVPPTKWKRVDAIGAGDAYNAGFIAGIMEGKPVETCGKMGNIMGGLATQTLGDTEGLPSSKEMHNYLTETRVFFR